MKTKLTALLMLLFCLHAAAQQRDTLQGRVTVADANAPGIFVINKNTGTEVKTNNKGLFKIPARNGDRLTVYSEKTVVREFYIDANAFKNPPYELAVDPQSYEIEEVVVTQGLSPAAFGLPENQKRYTVAERRLKTAGEFKPSLLFFLGGGISFPLDPIINAITGRTKMLKKELATERRQMAMEGITDIYNEEQIVSVLGIPSDKVQAFLFYIVEDPVLMQVMKEKNNERIKLELYVLAQRYLTLQQEEAGPAETPAQQPQQPAHED